MIETLLISILNGLSTGLSIALIAVGLTLTFGVLHIINLAHAEFYMIGAYFTIVCIGVIGNYWLALLVASIAVAALSLPIERLTLEPIRDRDSIYSLIITFALLFISHQAAFEIFGGRTQSMEFPVSGSLTMGPVTYPTSRLVIIVAAGLILILVWLFLERTRFGLLIRACAQDIDNARNLGVPADRIYSLTFAFGAFLAAIAAGFLAPLSGVYPTMGLDVLIDAFIVVIIGGLGSIPGAILAALLVGLTRSFSVLVFPSWVAQLTVFALVIVVLLIKPEGIF